MALSQRLEIRQSHALVMTPQLMQAIKLLQLSNLDLAAYVEGELERNPLLEQIGEGDGEADRRTPDRESPSFEQAAAPDWQNGSPDRKDGVTHERLGADLEDVPPADSDAATSRSNGEALGTITNCAPSATVLANGSANQRSSQITSPTRMPLTSNTQGSASVAK